MRYSHRFTPIHATEYGPADLLEEAGECYAVNT